MSQKLKLPIHITSVTPLSTKSVAETSLIAINNNLAEIADSLHKIEKKLNKKLNKK